jgi:hypothetical protein
MDQDRQDRIVANRNAPWGNRIWILGLIAVAFICLAFGGSYFTAHKINQAADEHGSSAGRSGDPAPNLRQTQPQPSTSGANPDSAVPPPR